MPEQEAVIFTLDDTPYQAGLKRMNYGTEQNEKLQAASLERQNAKLTQNGKLGVEVFDRSKSAIDRMLSSVDRMASMLGKTGIERLNVQFDQATKKLIQFGSNDKEIDKLTAAFKRAAAAQKEMDAAAGNGTGRTFFLGLKDMFEGRSAYSMVEFGKTIAGMSGIAMAAGGLVAGFAILDIAGTKATESLANYAVEVTNVGLRTGLSAKEVAQFSFAARAVGQDISVYERGMRGLTEAIEDNSSAGEKARKALKDIGVTPNELNGAIKPTGELLQEISAGLNGVTDTFARNEAGMAIFKRSWIEMSPAILELSTKLKMFKDNNLFAPTSDDISKWNGYKDQIEIADALWDKLGMKLKAGIAGTIWINIKAQGAKFLMAAIGEGSSNPVSGNGLAPDNLNDGLDLSRWLSRDDDAARAMAQPGASSPSANAAANARLARTAAGGGLEGAQRKLSQLKEDLDKSRTYAETRAGTLDALHANMANADLVRNQSAYDSQKSLVESIEKGPGQANELAEMIRSFVGTKDMSPLDEVKSKYADDLRKLNAMPISNAQKRQALTQLQIANIGRTSGALHMMNSDMSAGFLGLSGENNEKGYFENLSDTPAYKSIFGSLNGDGTNTSTPFERVMSFNGASAPLQLTSRDIYQNNVLAEKRAEGMIGVQAGPGDEVATQNKLFSMRYSLIQQEATLKKNEADAEFATEREHAQKRFDIDTDFDRKLKDIQQERVESILRLQKGQEEEISKTSEGLLHTLFTQPKNFGSDLGHTLRDAALKPIEGGIADLIKKPINGLIHGSDGNGGISGAFHKFFGGSSSADPLTSTATNTGTTVSILDKMYNLMCAGSGVSPDPIAGVPPTSHISIVSGGGRGGGYGVLPIMIGGRGGGSSSGGSSTGYAGSGGYSGGGAGSVGETISYAGGDTVVLPGGTYGSSGGGGGYLVDANGIPMSNIARAPMGALSMSGGSGSSAGHSQFGPVGDWVSKVSKNPKALLSSVYNSSVAKDYGGGAYGDTMGVLASPAAGALGAGLLTYGMTGPNKTNIQHSTATVTGGALMGASNYKNLASMGVTTTTGGPLGGGILGAGAGLMVNGVQRGGVGGMLEDAAGGAAMGFELGGPIGAGIGAVVGLVVGGVRMLVSTFREQVKNQVKKLYGLTLSDGMADQIGQIAKQTYGGSISAAIRSPQVEQMLSAYAAATGQKFLFSNQPRPLYLTESGGQLTQQATYVNGQAYSYSGGVPVYGGVSTQNLPQAALNLTTSAAPNNLRFNGAAPAMALQLDGPATTALLSGQIANSSQQVASAFADAQSSSFYRRGNATNIMNPSLVTS